MDAQQKAQIERMRDFPDALETLLEGLSISDLTGVFLPGEWTVAQNVHHLADAQSVLFFRFKLIALADHPTVTPFDQDVFAESADAIHADLEESLAIIRGVHLRWARLAESLSADQWARSGHHPENGELFLTALFPYACEHGYVHLEQIRKTLAAR